MFDVEAKSTVGSIDFNFDELKNGIINFIDLYRDTEVTEATIPVCKKELAGLRKVKKALNDKKIQVKKEYLEPYTLFETKVKELLTLIDSPIELIDSQIKEFEDLAAVEKTNQIMQIMSEEVPADLKPYFAVDIKKDWLNKSTSLKKIREEISEKVFIVKTNVESLTTVCTDEKVRELVLKKYSECFDLTECIKYKADLEHITTKEPVTFESLSKIHYKVSIPLEDTRMIEDFENYLAYHNIEYKKGV